MSDLLSLLSLGSAAISAQNTGISVATNNVANANTVGYSRQRADLDALEAAPLVGGVRSGSPDRFQDNLLYGRIQTAAGSLAMSQAFADALSELESGLASGGATIDEQVGALFSKLSVASAGPTDSSSRNAVVAAARDLVSGIQRRSADVAAARKDADARIRDGAVSATALAKQLAAANTAVARSNDPTQRDHRDQVAKQLGQLVGGQARIDPDGQMRYVLDGGGVLVDGGRAASLAATPDPTSGYARLEVVDGAARRDVTSAIGSGALGASLQLRDHIAAAASTKLDQLAYDVTTSMNATHTANAGLDGVGGRPMFAPIAQVAGAAGQMAVDPALAADSNLLALGAPGAGPGDNQGALALFAIAARPVASGGTRTLGESALDVVSGVALAAADAKGSAKRDGLVSEHLAGLRDSLAGVDPQEELTNLARFEHASSAMVKFVTTIDGMLGSLIYKLLNRSNQP
jgi:flagellar hook-associated protein 1 FlgK